MMRVENICRCGNNLGVPMAEQLTGENEYPDIMGCAHCDNVCILNRRVCSFCQALDDSQGDSEYYAYN